MKIATTTGDLSGFTATPAEAVRAFEGTGFRYLDFSFYDVLSSPCDPFMGDDWKRQIYEARDAAEALGMKFVQAHAPSCAIRGEGSDIGLLATCRSIEACGILGIENMVIHSGFFREIPYDGGKLEYFEANAPFFKALIPYMDSYGVNILFENTTKKHCPNDCFFPITGKDLKDIAEYMGHPRFGAAWDVGHANMDGFCHDEELRALGSTLKAIHVHDNDGRKDQHLAPYLGCTDYDALLRGLIDIGYEGYFTFEANNFFKHNRIPSGEGRLVHLPAEIKKASISMLYSIGRAMLTEYGVYEE